MIASGVIWGVDLPLSLDEAVCVHIGPLELTLERRAGEWRASWRADPIPNDTDAFVERLTASGEHLDDADAADIDLHRYGLPDDVDRFTLVPRLADRPVVIRPARPLRLVAGASIDVYVSTPVWAVVELPGARELLEVPTLQPTDTWFGPNTVEGELCYGVRTSARLSLAEVPVRPGRAITRVRVTNRTRGRVSLERVLLPAPELQPYHTPDGSLWTQAVEVDLAEAGASDLRYVAGPPRIATNPTPIGLPRRVGGRRYLARALSALWS